MCLGIVFFFSETLTFIVRQHKMSKDGYGKVNRLLETSTSTFGYRDDAICPTTTCFFIEVRSCLCVRISVRYVPEGFSLW